MTDIIFPTLPQGHQRFSVEQLLIELAPALGLRGGRLHALLYMMKQTSPGDWTNPDREPVYFVPQDQTAEALNKTRRALYNDESALEAAGLVEKRVRSNGSRSPFGGCGIVFSRLIALVPDLLHLKEQLAAERGKRKVLRNQRSTYVRHVKRRMRNATDTALTHPHLSASLRCSMSGRRHHISLPCRLRRLRATSRTPKPCVQHWIRSLKHVLILLLNRQKTSRALYKRTNKNLHL